MKKQYLFLLVALALLMTSIFPGAGVQASSREMSRKDLEELVPFDYDEGLFAVYAFLNYTGFDHNNDMRVNPFRLAVRDDLAAQSLDLMDDRYFLNHDYTANFYRGFLLIGSGPPHFQPLHYDELSPQALRKYNYLHDMVQSDVDRHLADFYEKAGIHDLYEKYRSDYELEIADFKDYVYDSLEALFRIFKLDPKLIEGRFVVDVNYLEAAGNMAWNRDLPDFRRDGKTALTLSPNPNNNLSADHLVAELVYPYVKPVLEANDAKVRRFIEFNRIEKTPYYDPHTAVERIFTETLAAIPAGRLDNPSLPVSQAIFHDYISHYDHEKGDLESLILRALDKFSGLPLQEAEKEKAFSDVPPQAWYSGYVHRLRQRSIVSGYKNSNDYGPHDPLTREQAAKMITEAAGLSLPDKWTRFDDVTPGSWGEIYIAALTAKGAASGFKGSNDFRPKAHIIRSHVSKIVALAFDLETGPLSKTFSDMPRDQELAGYIKLLASNGIVSGHKGTDQFRPDEKISRAEFAKLVVMAEAVAAVQRAEKQLSSDAIKEAQLLIDQLPANQDLESRKNLQKRLDALRP